MMMAIDMAALYSRISLVETIERHGVELKKKGNEFTGLCPFHDEKSPSFYVTEGKGFHCFGCGVNGTDQIGFIQEYHSLGFKEAAAELARMVGTNIEYTDGPVQKTKCQAEPDEQDIWQLTEPTGPWQAGDNQTVPVIYPRRQHDDPKRIKPIRFETAHIYRDGVILRSVINEKKLFQTLTHRVNTQTGESGWAVLALPEPRCLYRMDLLSEYPGAVVLLVEGEKTADAVNAAMGSEKLIAVSWAGGSKAVDKSDWSALSGRKVIAWPDADRKAGPDGVEFAEHKQAGMAAMLKVSAQGDQRGFTVKIVRPPADAPDGWDLADAFAQGWTADQVRAYYRGNLFAPGDIIPSEASEPPVDDYFEPDDEYIDPMPLDAEPSRDGPEDMVRFLGWESGRGYYLPAGFRQVVELSTNQHTKLNLLQLAPMRWWREVFPSEKRGGDPVDWDMVADAFIRQNQNRGVFDRKLIRGRGAWYDAGRSVVHSGSRLIVDGVPVGLGEIDSDYVYQMAKHLAVNTENPLPDADGREMINVCRMIRWEDQMAYLLLAGWCFLAPICGSLHWRPHIWITGASGSGKSTVLNDVMKPTLGRAFLFVSGDTTEAGVRQRLRSDALPVVFDEFESEREKSANRTKDILSLMRQASTETGAEIVKGGAGGKDDSYLIRSMFAFSSISVAMAGTADDSRVSVLSLRSMSDAERKSPENVEHYIKLKTQIATTLTPEYIERLHARAIQMIPTIRRNVQAFSDAIAMSPSLGTKRMGDQIGTLLAGAYSLANSGEITTEGALAWIEKMISNGKWTGLTESTGESDERICLQHILEHLVRVEGSVSTQTRSIMELIDIATGEPDHNGDDNINRREADGVLPRYGLRCVQDDRGWWLYVSNTHKEIGRILRDTPWKESWGRILGRMEGAEPVAAKKFAGLTTRAVALPIELVRADPVGD